MTGHNPNFDRRIKQIVRKHDRLAKGAVRKQREDGLIVARPRMLRPRFPWRIILIVICTAFVLKTAFLALVGDEAYDARLAALAQGGTLDQAGAWLMHIDPVTRVIADLIAPYLG